jgi:hydrogenase maturation protease
MNILIAGVGNIFLGDDAFGVEVARELATRPLPAGVRVRDFGLRGIDLGYELNPQLDAAIVVDTAQRGGVAGTLYVIDPNAVDPDTPSSAGIAEPSPGAFSAHAMDPVSVFEWARHSGGGCRRLLLLCCEPESFGTDTPEQGRMGLSAPVLAAVPRAVAKIENLVKQLMDTAGATYG